MKVFNVSTKQDELGFITNMDGHKSLLTAEYLWLSYLQSNTIFDKYTEACKMVGEFERFIPLNNGVYVRDWKRNAYEESNKDKHDNGFAICSINEELAKQITRHGYTHLGHYDNVGFKQNTLLQRDLTILGSKLYFTGILAAIFEHLQHTRQPYQLGAYSLMGYGVCDPLSYLHLLLVALIEPFKKGSTSGKKLLFLFSCNVQHSKWWNLGRPIAWCYRKLMNKIWGKDWVEKVFEIYYRTSCPELADLAKGVKI